MSFALIPLLAARNSTLNWIDSSLAGFLGIIGFNVMLFSTHKLRLLLVLLIASAQLTAADSTESELDRELAAAKSATAQRKWLERFDVKVGENPLKNGWEGGNLEDGKLDFLYIWQLGNTFLRSRWIPGTEANALKKSFDWDTSEFPYLKWKWRVQKFPTGAKILEGKKSDAAAQVYLLWKGFPTYYVIKYFWATDDTVGTLLEQGTPLIGKLRGLVIRSGGKAGQWQNESRNVAEDFRKYFGGDPPGKVRGIAILSDADETKTQSEADYDDFEVSKKP
jgi:hypothetical protein